MPTQSRRSRASALQVASALVFLLIVSAVSLGIEPLHFKPGFNMYSPQQDVQLGKQNAAQVDKQMPMLNDPTTVNYLNRLGKHLATFEPNNQSIYAWQFKVINTSDINAFALPGGFIYVNRGTIEAAQDEAQLAGVIAHEEGHVVMRHGTHQASEMAIASKPLSILGAVLGAGGSAVGTVSQAVLGLGVNSIFLHNSRGIEAQADQVGTYTLYQSGYNPYAMAQFFQILKQKYPQQTLQFFSDHPNPGNRVKAVDAEIPQLGPAKKWITDSPEFESVKRHLQSLPPPPPPKRP